MENEEFKFEDKLKDINLLYTQMINGKRIINNKVAYVFDEVGCGKTISAIIAMASVIQQCQEVNKQGYKILVFTPSSVCNQFESEIKRVLKIDNVEDIVKNWAWCSGKEIEEKLNKIMDNDKVIIVANPNYKKIPRYTNKIWDLIIIDEAHDIVCNSQKQAQIYFGDKIDNAYKSYQRKTEISNNNNKLESRSKYIKEYIKTLDDAKNRTKQDSQYIKYIAIEEYNNLLWKINPDGYDTGKISIPEHRQNMATFGNMCRLRAERVMFLTATPYKNNKDIDFLNYALLASKLVTTFMFSFNCLPNFGWVQKVYSQSEITRHTLSIMEESNTSLFFKEIALAIPFKKDESNDNEIKPKERKVAVWKEEEKSIKDRIFSLINERNNTNRFLIFVSNSREGATVFKKMFPDAEYDIVGDINHRYTNKDDVTCEFIMNKFGNGYKLKNYSEENNLIPRILIVTWQVAQVGINLPTYNYVVNYHISAIPGYLEQRYGRIDRLNTKNNPLWNIYYLDEEQKTNLYKINLIRALYTYKNEIMDIPHNMPVKNLLLCKDIKFNTFEEKWSYETLAFYVFHYLNDGSANVDEVKKEINKAKELVSEIIIYESAIQLNDTEYSISEPYVNDEIETFIVKDRENDEDSEEEDKKDRNKELLGKIKEIVDVIVKIEDINEMVKKINNAENLGEAGSIIFWNKFWNKEHESITVKCSDLAKKIIECRN